MPITDSDLFLIEDTSGVSKKIEASKLKANLASGTYDNYKLLVNKPDYSSRFVYAQNMQASVGLTDYMLVERGGTSYKVNGQQIIDYFPSVPAGAAGPITDVVNTNIDGAWTLGTNTGNTKWRAATFGAGRFVAVGDQDSRVMYSDDGKSWTNVTPPELNGWRSVTYGGDRFLAIAYNNRNIMYSTTRGETWTISQTTSSQQWRSVAYGNGTFVVTATGHAQYSTNGGDSWTASTGVKSNTWNSVTFGNGRFVAVGASSNERAMWSDDGVVWRDVSTPNGSSNSWADVTYGNGLFVAVGSGTTQNVMTSPDGKVWTPVTMEDTASIAFGDGTFTAVGNRGYSFTSTDAITWAKHETPSGLIFSSNSSAYGNGTFVAVSQTSQAISSPTGGGTQSNSELTLASDTNLDLFTVGDAINMVDEDGDVASYIPVTSTIASVETSSYAANSVLSGTTYGNYPISNAFDGTDIPVGPTAGSQITFTPSTAIPINSTLRLKAYVSNTSQAAGLYINTVSQNTQAIGIPFSSNAQLPVTEWTTIPNPPSSLTALMWRQETAWLTLAGIEIDGVELIDSQPTLTFASPNKDLKFFNPGDVVQGSLIPSQIYSANPGNDWIGYGGGSTYGVEQAFTGSTSNNAQSQQPRATIAFTNFPVGKVGLIVDSGAIDDPVTFYEINGTPINSSNTTSSSWITGGKILYEFNTEVALTSIVQVSSNSSSSKALYGITINGNIIIDGQSIDSNSVQVISTDTTANTMVVDGGAWRGSDGSDSGLGFFSMSLKNAAGDVLEYELTAPTIVRAPDYNVHTDPVVTETITANSAGTLDISLHSTSGDSTYVITLNGGTTTSFPLSGTLANSADNVPQFVFANAGDSFEIEYTFSTPGLVHVLHYANAPGSNRKVQWNGINVLFDGTEQNVEINGVLPGGGSGPVETEVTGPEKSGTGNFLGNTGPVVDVSNSNQEWIDNDNRLDESFFIKSASNRTGLAILRTKAIAQSQAWAADSNYLAEQLVKHNGRYWFALSSSYSNSPDETDTSDWFDLGPIGSSAVEPIAVNGYYPLYTTSTAADAASSSYSHHTHTFDGVTYYMPNGGTIYHGNYTG